VRAVQPKDYRLVSTAYVSVCPSDNGMARLNSFFTARRYASAVHAGIVCVSVCPSRVGVLLKRLNVGSRKQRRTICQGL